MDKIKKDITEFYDALNEFFDWCGEGDDVVAYDIADYERWKQANEK